MYHNRKANAIAKDFERHKAQAYESIRVRYAFAI